MERRSVHFWTSVLTWHCKLLSLMLALATFGCETKKQRETRVVVTTETTETELSEPVAPLTVSRESALSQANDLFRSGKFVQAKQVLQPLLIRDPDDSQTLFMFARCLAGTGDLQQAVATLDNIASTDSQAAFAALGQSADWLMQLGEFSVAAERYEQILSKRGDVILAHRRLAEIRNLRGERFSARKHLRFLLSKGNITLRELMALHCVSDPFFNLEKLPKSLDGRAMTDLTHAREMFLKQEISGASKIVHQLMDSFPGNTEVFAFAGRVLNRQLDDEDLESWRRRLPENIQQHPEYWNALGEWLLRNGQYMQATRALCESALHDPSNRSTYAFLSQALIALDQPELSRATSERYELLEQGAIALWNANKPDAGAAEFESLAIILDQLHRPKEALMWRIFAARKSPQDTRIEKLTAQFGELSANDLKQDDKWNVCGIDWTQYPLPDGASLSSSLVAKAQTPTPNSFQGFAFTNVADATGLRFSFRADPSGNAEQFHMYQILGGGVAATDFDRDGWCDVVFTQAAGNQSSPGNPLYRNLAGEQFTEVSKLAGTDDREYGQGITVADLNQDGFDDLAISNIGSTLIHFNNGDGTFRTSTINVDQSQQLSSTSIACGDINGDHLPEMVVLNYIDDPAIFARPCFGPQSACNPRGFTPAADSFYSVTADGQVKSWQPGTEQGKKRYGLGLLLGNLDGQTGSDLFIANDTVANELWVSDTQADLLSEQALPRGVAVTGFGQAVGSMGVAHGDFDRNGTLDLHITNFAAQSSNLYLQNQQGLFFDRAAQYRLHEPTMPMVGFGTQAIDLDHDGWLDLVIVNGHVRNRTNRDEESYRMLPQLFRGKPGEFDLIDPSELADPYWTTPNLGRPLAVLDWNSDGRMDLVASHLDLPAALLENQTQAADWIQLELVGTISERDAIGARVEIAFGDESWVRWITSGDGFHCKNQALVHVGLGHLTTYERKAGRVAVTWPSGRTQKFSDLQSNQRWLVIENRPGPFARTW